ncbi:hypothetical protein ACP70R_024801 [Stipagrostis hirtigluma subsp. patula]
MLVAGDDAAAGGGDETEMRHGREKLLKRQRTERGGTLLGWAAQRRWRGWRRAALVVKRNGVLVL